MDSHSSRPRTTPGTPEFDGPPDLREGEICVWHCVPRGGYGFATRVPCQIARLTAQRVRIEFFSPSGDRKYERAVAIPSLRHASDEERRDHVAASTHWRNRKPET